MEAYTDLELSYAKKILYEFTNQSISQGIDLLRTLKDDVVAGIPEKKRQSQGITWVLQRISNLLVETSEGETRIRDIALTLYHHLEMEDVLTGAPIFMMGEYGEQHATEVFDFFRQVAASENWMVRAVFTATAVAPEAGTDDSSVGGITSAWKGVACASTLSAERLPVLSVAAMAKK